VPARSLHETNSDHIKNGRNCLPAAWLDHQDYNDKELPAFAQIPSIFELIR